MGYFVTDMPRNTLVCPKCFYQGQKLNDHLRNAHAHSNKQQQQQLLRRAKDVRDNITHLQAITEANLKVKAYMGTNTATLMIKIFVPICLQRVSENTSGLISNPYLVERPQWQIDKHHIPGGEGSGQSFGSYCDP